MNHNVDHNELKSLKWVGIGLAVLTTVFTLVVVGSHLAGRLVGFGRLAIAGVVGAEFVAIVCAYKSGSKNPAVALTALACGLLLTALLLWNATIASDLDWREKLADKASERETAAERLRAEERRKDRETEARLIRESKQADAKIAQELLTTDKSAGRAYVKKQAKQAVAAPALEPTPEPTPPPSPTANTPAETQHIEIGKLDWYERYGLTIAPLLLAALTIVALTLAAIFGPRQIGQPGEAERRDAERIEALRREREQWELEQRREAARTPSSPAAPPRGVTRQYPSDGSWD